MKLRHQLFLISLLLLSLPWAGCQYLQAVDVALRDLQATSLTSNAKSIADRLLAKPELFSAPYLNASPSALSLYAHSLRSQPIVDGYKDDWRNYESEVKVFENESLSASLMLGLHKKQVYFFIEMQDAQLIYFNPSQTQGLLADHMVLTLHSDSGPNKKIYLYASAPGNMAARYRDENNRLRPFRQIKGVWKENATGYQMELEVNKSLLKQGFDIDFIDYRDPVENRLSFKDAAVNNESYKQLELVTPSEALASELLSLNVNVASTYILNANQLVVASKKIMAKKNRKGETPWFIEWLYRKSLDVSDMPPRAQYFKGNFLAIPNDVQIKAEDVRIFWYRVQGPKLGGQSAVSVAAPLFAGQRLKGFLVLEQTTDSLIALTSSAFNRLFLYTLSVFLLIAMGLIAYASWLSWRVTRLNRAANHVVTDQGLISIDDNDWPELKAGDELGDLSRSYRQLLLKLRESQAYLRGLSSKLSHELRTPIAIVRSSLDNIAEVTEPLLQQQYNQRAQEGIERLNHILNTMSAANRIEESLLGAEFTATPLNRFLSLLAETYNDAYLGHHIQFIDESGLVSIALSQELFVQMLDKLLDNATDFSPEGEVVTIRLIDDVDAIVIQVENKGPLLPESMHSRLFESMVSLRSNKPKGNGVHLGLGLYIVRIIVELHQGQVFAENDDGKGVIFSVRLPI